MTLEDAEALSERGKMLCDLGRFEEAIKALGKAVALEPEDAWIRCRLAYAYYQTKAYPEALEHSEAAIAHAPQMEWGHRLRASVLQRWNPPRLKEAMESALEALKLEPESTMALYTVATLYVELNQMADARATAQRLLEVAPQESDTHDLMSFIELRAGKHAQAETHAREALRIDPDNNDALRFLASALQGQGVKKSRDAMHTWLEVVRRNPTEKPYQQRLLSSATSSITVRSTGTILLVIILSFAVLMPLLARLGVSEDTRLLTGLGMVITAFVAVQLWQQLAVRKLPAPVQVLMQARNRIKRRLRWLTLLDYVLIATSVLGWITTYVLVIGIGGSLQSGQPFAWPMLLSLLAPTLAFLAWRARGRAAREQKRLRKSLEE
jgi:tetratricopeptide (TPR) repeat protein